MRDFAEVETTEIADSDLDHVSGGFTVSGGVDGPISASGGVSVDGLDGALGTATSALSSLPTAGLTAPLTGAVSM